MAVVPVTYGLFFMRSEAGMAFYFAAQQFAFAIFRLNFIPYITEYTTPRSVGTIFGVVNAMNGVVRFTMVPLWGLFVDLMGKNYRLPLWGGYVAIAVCVLCLAAMRPPEKVIHLDRRGLIVCHAELVSASSAQHHTPALLTKLRWPAMRRRSLNGLTSALSERYVCESGRTLLAMIE